MVSDMRDEEGVLEDSLGGLGPSSPSLALCSLPGQSTALRAGEREVRAADGQARAHAGFRLSFVWFNGLISGLWQGDLWWRGNSREPAGT